ncbi:MAG: VWA domain-containing protein [Anaerolineales bacterium]
MRRIPRLLLSLSLIPLLMLWSVPVAFAQTNTPQLHITQVDKSHFPQVTVYVSAVDANGQPVGIDPKTIQISENGQPMQVTDVRGGGMGSPTEKQIIPVTTMLVMDISGSMDKNGKLDAAKEAAKAYVAQMRPGDQAGLITYDTKTYYVQPVTADTAALTAAIDSVKTGGDTAMYNALVEAERNLESVTGRKAIIVMTDGLDNSSQSTADDVITGIGQSGLTISAIGFGDTKASGQQGLDEAGLKSLAEKTGGLYSFADVQSLASIYQQYGEALQSEYALTYISPTTLRDGVNRGLSVSLGANTATTETRYNPGGLIPEVTAQSWSLFSIILLGLLALLFLPWAVNRGLDLIGNIHLPKPRKKANIKMTDIPASSARGRVKMK